MSSRAHIICLHSFSDLLSCYFLPPSLCSCHMGPLLWPKYAWVLHQGLVPALPSAWVSVSTWPKKDSPSRSPPVCPPLCPPGIATRPFSSMHFLCISYIFHTGVHSFLRLIIPLLSLSSYKNGARTGSALFPAVFSALEQCLTQRRH